MSFQSSFLVHSLPQKKKLKKAQFLSHMQEIIPWQQYKEIITPYWHKKGKDGRPKTDALLLLRITFLQQWYALSDEAVEEEIYNQILFQNFLDLNLSAHTVPDATTIENFRHVLETYDLASKIFDTTNRLLEEKNILLKKGSAVDATLIKASSSTKNKKRKRDPEMGSTKKNNNWHFGAKAHVGVDIHSRCIHTLKLTKASHADTKEFETMLHGQESIVYADKAYHKKKRIQELRKKGVTCNIHRKARKGEKLSSKHKQENTRRSKTRAKGEHPFHVIKNIFHYKKVRYRGIRKNETQFLFLATLSNIYMTRNLLSQFFSG